MRRRTPAASVFNLGTGRGVQRAGNGAHLLSARSTMFPIPYVIGRAPRRRSGNGLRRPRQERGSCLAGRHRTTLADMCRDSLAHGRPGTRPDIKPGAFEKHIEPCTGTPVFRFRQKTVAFLKKRCYDISASNRQGSYIGSTAASQAAEAGSTPVPCSTQK